MPVKLLADSADHGRGNFGTGTAAASVSGGTFPLQIGAFTSSGNPQGSTTHRNVPDVSLFATTTPAATISISQAPAAGAAQTAPAPRRRCGPRMSRVSIRRASAAAVVGFANPVLYPIAEEATS